MELLPHEIIAMIGEAADPLTYHMLSLCRADWYPLAHKCECVIPCRRVCSNPYSMPAEAAAAYAAKYNYVRIFERILELGEYDMNDYVSKLSLVCGAELTPELIDMLDEIEGNGHIQLYDWMHSLPKCLWMARHQLVTNDVKKFALEYGYIDAIKIFVKNGCKLSRRALKCALYDIDSIKYVCEIFIPECFDYHTAKSMYFNTNDVYDVAQYGSVEVLKYLIEDCAIEIRGPTIMISAVRNDTADCFKYLYTKNYLPDEILLRIAIELSAFECVKFLRGTKTITVDHMITAAIAYNKEIFRYLLCCADDPVDMIKQCLEVQGFGHENADAIMEQFRIFIPDLK